MKLFLKKNSGLLLILFITFLLRFGGISWGLPYHFHPDEWNMANAVSQLSWANYLQPHFFAYGQLPLYLAYFSGRLYNLIPWINLDQVSPTEATFFLRFWSALAGVGTVYLVYLITKRFLTTNYPARIATPARNAASLAGWQSVAGGPARNATYSVAGGSLLATLLAAFTPGLIQISHFGTTESLLSFFFLAILYFSIKIVEEDRSRNYFFAGLVLGLALGTKISALVFAFPVIFALLLKLRQAMIKKSFFLFLCATAIFFFVSSPYVILNFSETKRILLYEAQVAAGQTPVFYTRQFLKTIPVLFQLEKIFPYTIGWPIFIFGILGWLISVVLIARATRKRKILNFACPVEFCKNSCGGLQLLTLNFAFLTYFASQAFLFTKWTRFMAPIFAFFPIFAALSLSKIIDLFKPLKFAYLLICLLVIFSIIPGLIFSTIYFRPDIRLTASEWIYKNIPSGAKVLSETGNVIDIPLPRRITDGHRGEGGPDTYNLSPISFDFYHLDENPKLFPQLLDALEKSDYIFIPSRRIFANHQLLPEKYPLTAKYYKLLFSGKLGFTEVKKISPFPVLQSSVFSLQFSDESAEETWSVFDHPVIRIYHKTTSLSEKQYENLFRLY